MDSEKQISLDTLTNKINNLYDNAYKTIYTIIKNNDEVIISTNNYYLIDLDNVKEKTIQDLKNYLKYLDDTDNEININENEKNKIKMELKQVETS